MLRNPVRVRIIPVMERVQSRIFRLPLITAVLVTFLLETVVGTADYYAPYQYVFTIFYLIPILFSEWYINAWFAVFISILSTGVAIYGDFEAGAKYSVPLTIWLIGVRLGFYFLVIWLIARLKILQEELEAKVLERTAALTTEMTKRKELEREILAVSEREQHRIGHELHDSLCQHLTGTALAGQVLARKISAVSPPEADAMKNIVKLTEEGIEMARSIARGLFPVEFDDAGLMSALEELAGKTTDLHGIDCRFECKKAVYINNPEIAGHLYRIAQEAVRNAVTHSHAGRILILFNETENGTRLVVRDNGTGIDNSTATHKGMGLKIMEYRSSMIGATFDIQSDGTGTSIACVLNQLSQQKQS